MIIGSVWFCGVSSIMWSEICKREIGEQRRREKIRQEEQNKELKKSTSEVLERSGHIYIHELQLQSFNSSSRTVLLRKSRRRQGDPGVEQGWSVVTWWRESRQLPRAAGSDWEPQAGTAVARYQREQWTSGLNHISPEADSDAKQ